MTDRQVILVTGFATNELADRLVRSLLHASPRNELRCVVSKSSRDRAKALVATMPTTHASRLKLLEGETWGLDFGLSGAEWTELAREVNVVHHASQTTQSGLDEAEAWRVNRGSTVEAIELAREARDLDRLVLWSSTTVAGKRRGFVLEDELDASIATRNPVEESLRKSELLVRAARNEIPTTVLRPGIVVGDSHTGDVDRLDGLYLLILLMLNAPPDQPMPLPVRPDLALPIVPIDYVVRAGLHLSGDPRARGATFHIVDPDPLTAGRVFELMAAAVGRQMPRSFLPPFIASRLMRLPGIQPGGGPALPSGFLDQIATEVVFDDHGTRTILQGSGIHCPAFESYVGALVRFVRERQLGAPKRSEPAESIRP